MVKIVNSGWLRVRVSNRTPGPCGSVRVVFCLHTPIIKRVHFHSTLNFYYLQNFIDYVAFAAFSKLVAASATYPYQVVRTRLQDQHHDYKGSLDCISRTWRSEGIKGFYKGISPYILHVTPNLLVVLFFYENFDDISKLIRKIAFGTRS